MNERFSVLEFLLWSFFFLMISFIGLILYSKVLVSAFFSTGASCMRSLRDFEMALSWTAKQIRLMIPQNVLARADKVIKWDSLKESFSSV
jgi:hypothetical protein